MRLAITGCTGRVGQRVVLAALKQGHSVVGIDTVPGDLEFKNDPKFTFIQTDLRNYAGAYNALQGCDAVVQLAACPNPGDYVAETHNT